MYGSVISLQKRSRIRSGYKSRAQYFLWSEGIFFCRNSTAENVLTNYTENYEYTGSVSNDEGTQTPEHTGKIDKATAAQITK